ncbi:NADH-quinone oxidoreductase subunit C [Fundidesulfovibrio terrae]|uniref:NADH-quinone oxidoreductase subunit C n=1 Tax=Fundidesulfovibrio terrae TaxID=2922866 RepID=UPI001FAF8ED7|nr:NADH-quinone oxidoreductase subunit C [Fundidesulfovibrio terrae]
MKLDEVRQAMAQAAPLAMAETEHSKTGYHLDVSVTPDRLLDAVNVLDRLGFFIETITGVDWLGEKAEKHKDALAKAAALAKARAAKAAEAAAAAEGEDAAPAEAPAPEPVAEPIPEPIPEPSGPDDLEVVFDFNRYDELCRVVVRTRTPRDNPRVPTIADIYPAAHWHERETHDFFGVVFTGHPYLVPLLLPEDADFHPLLKDFKA